MKTFKRIDVGSFKKPKQLKNGFLKADAVLTRAGIFNYIQDDKTVRRELRHPDVVFNKDNLESLQMAPLTLGHPSEAVTADNFQQHAVGYIGQDVRRDGDFVRATVIVTDAKTIKAIKEDGWNQLSCGYDAEMDMTPGVFRGQKYDVAQISMEYNHSAFVPNGRAGPDVEIKLDAGDAIQDDDFAFPQEGDKQQNQKKELPMKKLSMDGMTWEVEENLHQAVTNKLDSVQKETAALKTEVEGMKAKADAKDADTKTLQTKLDEAIKNTNDESVQQLVKERVALETSATKFLKEDVKLDKMSDADIKAAVIASVYPDLKLDEKSDDYIQAMFDASLQSKADASDDGKNKNKNKGNNGLGKIRKDADDAGDNGGSDDGVKTVAQAKLDWIDNNKKLATMPLSASKQVQ